MMMINFKTGEIYGKTRKGMVERKTGCARHRLWLKTGVRTNGIPSVKPSQDNRSNITR